MYKLVLIDMDEMKVEDWVKLAMSKSSTANAGHLAVHGDIASDGIRIHNGETYGTKRCDCGNAEYHKTLNEIIQGAQNSKVVFKIDRRYLLEALAGLDENMWITFACDGPNKPVLISDSEKSAIIMPVGIPYQQQQPPAAK